MSLELNTVGIVVKDMSKSLEFYRVLGLDIPKSADEEHNFDFMTPQGIAMGFLTESLAIQADPSYRTPNGSSINLQFRCDSAAEVDSAYKKLTDAGYTGYAEPWDAFWGQRFARVSDPDRRIVNIFAEL